MKFKLEGEITPIPSSSSCSIKATLLLIGDYPYINTHEEGMEEGVKGEGPEPKKKREHVAPKGFEAWYAIYPKKVARLDAEAAFAKLVKDGVGIQALMDATRKYCVLTSTTEPQYIKNPATFLRKERWRDYAPANETQKLSPEEMDSIRKKYQSGEYDLALVRKIEMKYRVKLWPEEG